MRRPFNSSNEVKDNLALIFIYFSLVFILVSLLIGFVGMRVWQFELGFIEPGSAFAESLFDLYNFIWIFLTFVLILVFILLTRILYLFIWNLKIVKFEYFKIFYNFFHDYYLSFVHIFFFNRDSVINNLYKINRVDNDSINFTVFYLNYDRYEFLNISDLNEHKKLEVIWSMLPALILILLIGPTFSLIFSLDPDIDPVYTVKVIGHQWYWTYAFDGVQSNDNYFNLVFDSVMKNESDLEKGQLRLLEVDNRLILPVCVPIRFLITATDVIHSWAVPALGLKVDAIPGRINQFLVEIKRPGVFYGQCSEICGPMHGFMPIVIQALNLNEFEEWLMSKYEFEG